MKWGTLAILFLFLNVTAYAQEFNAGFVQGLWYGSEAVFAEQPTRIYVAVRNNTGADLTGTVEFFVDEKRIEHNPISALDGRIIESWADWTPGYGEHTVRATLSRIELHQVGSSTKEVTVTSALAQDSFFVDYDTDGDGVSNKEDNDDDGDGIADEAEKENDTDPLDPSSPPPAIETTESEEEERKTTEQTESAVTRDSNTVNPQGIEQYLTESRADTVLTSFTDTVTATKKRLDDYRETRNATLLETEETMNEVVDAMESQSDSIASTSSTTSEDMNGFGEVRRTQQEGHVGILVTLLESVRRIISTTYTFVLFLVSIYLGHPIIVQLTLLLLILFIILKTAQRLSKRPQ